MWEKMSSKLLKSLLFWKLFTKELFKSSNSCKKKSRQSNEFRNTIKEARKRGNSFNIKRCVLSLHKMCCIRFLRLVKPYFAKKSSISNGFMILKKFLFVEIKFTRKFPILKLKECWLRVEQQVTLILLNNWIKIRTESTAWDFPRVFFPQ